jgi:hypothetical protein
VTSLVPHHDGCTVHNVGNEYVSCDEDNEVPLMTISATPASFMAVQGL